MKILVLCLLFSSVNSDAPLYNWDTCPKYLETSPLVQCQVFFEFRCKILGIRECSALQYCANPLFCMLETAYMIQSESYRSNLEKECQLCFDKLVIQRYVNCLQKFVHKYCYNYLLS